MLLARILLNLRRAMVFPGDKGVIEMRRALSLAIAGLSVLLVSAQAQAQTINFTAALHGGNEVPGVSTGAVGTGASLPRPVMRRPAMKL